MFGHGSRDAERRPAKPCIWLTVTHHAMPDAADPSPGTSPPVLAVVRDLLLSSRIAATARAEGAQVKVVRDPDKLGDQPGRLLIADLNQPGVVEAASAWSRATGGEVVGFVAHVDAGTIARARAAGIGRILPRSQFVQILPSLFQPVV